ncbi:family 78 glycoside hydrolase catalytic domain [Nocardioides sp. Soil796]|uniref:family 78 glycoside hydrolase catalytic domain n=1 Tax=Nocardioides sp. Soil796 TaxID=1736412 RepID=UPI00070FEBAF|nr:family 78 glycoside hydrolase catalytic domain [Nocardioides sp. Soil796]KRF16866.1 hydrolase [Nocardioides sp. Soil796]
MPLSLTQRASRVPLALLTALALAMVSLPPAFANGTTPVVERARATAPGNGLRVGTLEVEHQATPLGIDAAHPRFGWELSASGNGAEQSAYEIVVSTRSGRPEQIWDSGKVTSSRSVDVVYDGPALESRTRYSWQVRVWDAGGKASPWSAPARFETAFLDPEEFEGDWIGAQDELPKPSFEGASWIWFPAGKPSDSAPVGNRFFRTSFEVPAGQAIDTAEMQLTADDSFTLYVNGAEIVRSPRVQDAWRTATIVDIAAHLQPGRNVIAIEAVNAQPGPAGLLASLKVTVGGAGDPLRIVTDDTWVSSETAADGWQQSGFDDSAWPHALVGAAYGSGPWGSSVTVATPPEPLLRREFATDKPIASARAYVSGLGYYKLFVNGQRIGDHELDPGFTVYDKTVLYATYDVTDVLRSGDNAVGVSLGRGYYAMTRPDEWMTSPWHGEPKLKLQLDITYEDGTSTRVVSDDSWKLADGPTRTESLWFGETYDARLELPGWTGPGYDDASWRAARSVSAPEGTLTAQMFPPIKVTEPLQVGTVTSPRSGIHVYDFTSPTAGWAKVAVSGPAGAEVKITYGEKLRADGTVDNSGAFGMAMQAYTYILNGEGVETYRPSYSYAGFRYLQVEVPAGVEVESVAGERVHSAVPTTGDFHSSSGLLNRYQAAQANTILNNLHSVPTDTPMYEKRPYTADGQLISDSAIANFDVQEFYANWMRAHRDDLTPEGTLGHTVPGTVGGKQVVDPVWSASYVLVNWDLYWYYGDTRAIADNYDSMKAWLDHFERDVAKTNGIYTGFSYGDWLAPGAANPPEGTRLTGTAYLHMTATAMAKMATALGHDADAEHFTDFASSLADAINATFYDESEGAYYDDPAAGYRQTSNLFPLSLGIVPQEHRKTVIANLVKDIKDRGVHLNTGALGTKIILPVLTDLGYGELAYDVATNPTYPGWGYWFEELGATTMWEEWQESSRSHQHAFLGTVDDWLYQRVAGIEPAAPGYSAVRIKPYPVGDLKNASAHVSSPLGRVGSSWRRNRDHFTLRAEVPVGASGDIYVPSPDRRSVKAPKGATFVGMEDGYARFEVGSGRYAFRVLHD